MKNIFIPKRGDFCPNCNTARSIELYTCCGKNVNYAYMLDMIEKDTFNTDTLNNTDYHQFECNKCKYVYCIDWRYGLPTPIFDFKHINDFLLYFY